MANEVSEVASSFIGSGSGTGLAIMIAIGVVVVGGILAGAVAWVIHYISFNKKIVLWKKLGNKKPQKIITDRGKFERVGEGGDYWCRTRKLKKILPRPTKQAGPNEYWFYEREDGEWINFDMGDIDEQMRQAGAYYVDEDMRLQRLGIQKNLRDRFQKVGFWQKYGGMIMNLIFLIVVTIMLVVLFKEMRDNWAVGREMASAVRDMAVEVANLRKQTGSGAEFVEALLPLAFLRRKKR